MSDGAGGGELTADDKLWGMLAHLSPILCGIFGPLIVWLVKKEQSSFVADNAKEALNFQITLFFGFIVLFVMAVVLAIVFVPLALIPYLGIIALGLGSLVLSIIGGIKANGGERYKYPFAIRLIK